MFLYASIREQDLLVYSQASTQQRSPAWLGLAEFQAWRLVEAVSVCFVGAAVKTESQGQVWKPVHTHTHKHNNNI